MKTEHLAKYSVSTLALSVAPNEGTGSPGGTSLTLASCTNRHNTNLAHLVSLGQLKGGEKVQITCWNCFLYRSSGLGLQRPRQQQQTKPVCLIARLFAICYTNGIYLPYILQIWLL